MGWKKVYWCGIPVYVERFSLLRVIQYKIDDLRVKRIKSKAI